MGIDKNNKKAVLAVDSDSPVLKCKLFDREVRMLVDTGSKVTLVQPYIYNQVKRKIEQGACKLICPLPYLIGATGHTLELTAGYNVPLHLATKQYVVPLLFSKTKLGITADGIIGNDTLMKYDLDVIAGRLIRIGEKTIPLENMGAREPKVNKGDNAICAQTNQSYAKGAQRNDTSEVQTCTARVMVEENPRARPNSEVIRVKPHPGVQEEVPHWTEMDIEELAAFVKKPTVIPANSDRFVEITFNYPVTVEEGDVAMVGWGPTQKKHVTARRTMIDPDAEKNYQNVINWSECDVTLEPGMKLGQVKKAHKQPKGCTLIREIKSTKGPREKEKNQAQKQKSGKDKELKHRNTKEVRPMLMEEHQEPEPDPEEEELYGQVKEDIRIPAMSQRYVEIYFARPRNTGRKVVSMVCQMVSKDQPLVDAEPTFLSPFAKQYYQEVRNGSDHSVILKKGMKLGKVYYMYLPPGMYAPESETSMVTTNQPDNSSGQKAKVGKKEPHLQRPHPQKGTWEKLQHNFIREATTKQDAISGKSHPGDDKAKWNKDVISSQSYPVTDKVEPGRNATNKLTHPEKNNVVTSVTFHTSKQTVIPPRTEMLVDINLSDTVQLDKNEVVICEPSSAGDMKVYAGRTLIDPDAEDKKVAMINLNEHEVILEENLPIGEIAIGYLPTECALANQVVSVDDKVRIVDTRERRQKILESIELDKSKLTIKEYEQFADLIEEYHSVFRLQGDPHGYCKYTQHKIQLQDQRPINKGPYRCAQTEKEELKRQVEDLLKEDVIEHSGSSWGAGCLLVKKKDGGYRMCIDYRPINKSTKPFSYPLPLIADVLDELGQAKYFTVMDLASGYHQIEMAPEDREKTAFNVPWGKYHFKRMPFGLRNSPASFQSLMDLIFSGLKGNTLLIYMDDIVIFSDTVESHLAKLKLVLSKLKQANLKLKPSKCEFLKDRVEYLGHVISAKGVQPQKRKIEAIEKFPIPQNIRELQSFLGCTNYYRRFIQSFSEHAKPLCELLKGHSNKSKVKVTLPWVWGPRQQEAFDYLRTCLMTQPLLRNPDYSKPFILKTDASKFSIGAELVQPDEEGRLHPVAYLSRQMNSAETRYSVIEQELLAVVYAIQHFRCHLYGRHFTLRTDHRPLRYLLSLRNPTSRLARWSLKLQEYDFTVEYIPGKSNCMADCLSRIRIENGQLRKEEVFAMQESMLRDEFYPHLDEVVFRQEQLKDIEIQRIKTEQRKGFEEIGGLMYKTWKTEMQELTSNQNKRIVVPDSLKMTVMRAYHETPYAAHLGFDKTVDKVRERYYWKGLPQDLKRYCEECWVCQRRNKTGKTKIAPMQPVSEVSRPFQRISMDVLCNLPTTYQGNKHLLVVTDHLSRYVEAFPMQKQDAETIARIISEKIFCRYGFANQLLTDKGSNFLSKMFKGICDHFKVKKVNTSSYRPQSNGICERLNRSILNMLASQVSASQKEWDEKIPYILLALNSSVHKTTKEKPYFLMYGRDPILPTDQLVVDKIKPLYNYDDYSHEMVHKMETAFKRAKDQIGKTFKAQKAYYDKKSEEIDIKVGMKVWLHNPEVKVGLTKKLSLPWKGPYRVISKFPKANFEIKEVNSEKTQVVHANRLLPCKGVGPFDTMAPELIVDNTRKETRKQKEIGVDWDDLDYVSGYGEDTSNNKDRDNETSNDKDRVNDDSDSQTEEFGDRDEDKSAEGSKIEELNESHSEDSVTEPEETDEDLRDSLVTNTDENDTPDDDIMMELYKAGEEVEYESSEEESSINEEYIPEGRASTVPETEGPAFNTRSRFMLTPNRETMPETLKEKMLKKVNGKEYGRVRHERALKQLKEGKLAIRNTGKNPQGNGSGDTVTTIRVLKEVVTPMISLVAQLISKLE